MWCRVTLEKEWFVMHSNKYTIGFTAILTIILASLLSFAAVSLNKTQKLNVELDSKKNIDVLMKWE